MIICLYSRPKSPSLNKAGYLDQGIVFDREALELYPPGRLKRSISLTNLSIHLSGRYDQLGATVDLEVAIDLSRGRLDLFPIGHPGQSMSFNTLSVCLFTWYIAVRVDGSPRRRHCPRPRSTSTPGARSPRAVNVFGQPF